MKKILFGILAIFIASVMVFTPVFAEKCTCGDGREGVVTSILGNNGCSCDDGKGSSIIGILKLVVDIMSVGVGILGAIGISVFGIQYLTAGGNEEKVRKAKHRIFQIVLGLAIYVAVYILLRWLLPGFEDSAKDISLLT